MLGYYAPAVAVTLAKATRNSLRATRNEFVRYHLQFGHSPGSLLSFFRTLSLGRFCPAWKLKLLSLETSQQRPGNGPSVDFAANRLLEDRWEDNRRHVGRLICDAQVVTHLSPNWSHSMPACETRLRPLFSLTPQQANLAWGRAIELAHGRKVSTRFIKAYIIHWAG